MRSRKWIGVICWIFLFVVAPHSMARRSNAPQIKVVSDCKNADVVHATKIVELNNLIAQVNANDGYNEQVWKRDKKVEELDSNGSSKEAIRKKYDAKLKEMNRRLSEKKKEIEDRAEQYIAECEHKNAGARILYRSRFVRRCAWGDPEHQESAARLNEKVTAYNEMYDSKLEDLEKRHDEATSGNEITHEKNLDDLDAAFRKKKKGLRKKDLKGGYSAERAKLDAELNVEEEKLKRDYTIATTSNEGTYDLAVLGIREELKKRDIEVRAEEREMQEDCSKAHSFLNIRTILINLSKDRLFPSTPPTLLASHLLGEERHSLFKKIGISSSAGPTFSTEESEKLSQYDITSNTLWDKAFVNKFIGWFEKNFPQFVNKYDFIQFCVLGKMDEDHPDVKGFSLKSTGDASSFPIMKYSFISAEASPRTFLHELGHCLLGEGDSAHTDNPNALMAQTCNAKDKTGYGSIDLDEAEIGKIRSNLKFYLRKNAENRVSKGMLGDF